MKRREILKELSLLPLAGSMVGSVEAFAESRPASNWFRKAAAQVAPAMGPLKAGPQIYQSIGVEPIINCRGTFTIIGASMELPEVKEAMEYASRYNVQIDELAFGIGKRLSEITGAEWGMVSSGCAAGLNEVTAGILAGGNPEKLIRIPNLEGFEKTEVIIPRSSRNVYDHAIRNCGVKVITVHTLEELETSINPRTAMIYMMPGQEPWTVANVAKIAKPKNVPILVDAAAERLTIPNIHLQAGASVVGYSGGKVIRGPQSAGLLLGNKDILMSAWQASAPHHGPCRNNKIGREEQIGMLAAVEAWAVRDHKAEMDTWVSWLETISKKLSGINGVQLNVRRPEEGALDNATPMLTISWDPTKLHITGQEVADELATTKPRVAVGTGFRRGQPASGSTPPTTSITIAAYMMGAGNEVIVAKRVHEILTRKRSASVTPTEMKAPAADLSGRWEVSIDFYTSKSQHTFIIEKQDGNWLTGTHKGEFAARDLIGSIEGDEVRFQSRYSVPGDNLVMTFYGKLSGDTITGEIDMVEYINAKFTAKRSAVSSSRQRIVVPSGRPFST
ncbi:seryl-tRNA(Sec) selenium transferase [Larkinella arboricola]|uniref:Seryl-tRNA(Sec) selenium transferase n=1 Tax=Larkinella arboricola TaxID=643671 RepID=A0A327WZB4_LARAB|nr:PLP-dependent transferase [Larkinella arboricola]RAJ97494.1 seryl-tRNA(Sec) selenium transferase [Larkinella arboricola]